MILSIWSYALTLTEKLDLIFHYYFMLIMSKHLPEPGDGDIEGPPLLQS